MEPVKVRGLLVACAALAAVALPGSPSRASTDYSPAVYELGPKGGDAFNVVLQTKEAGRVSVVRAYPIPGAFNCGGSGGFGAFRVRHHGTIPANRVYVQYKAAAASPFAFVYATVRKAATEEFIGVDEVRGPLAGDGTLRVDLAGLDPAERTDVIVDFGLRVSSACPSVEIGSAQFAYVRVTDEPDWPPPGE